MKKKIELMHQQFGVCEGRKCKECSNFEHWAMGNHKVRKCTVYGVTGSEASDWTGRWTACGMFDKEYHGRPIIKLRVGMPKPPPEPWDNQITLFGQGGAEQ